MILPPVVCWHRSAARGTWHPDPDYRSRAGEIDCAEPAWIQTPANHLDQATTAHQPGQQTAKAISASTADAESE
jgi:hypothetical protein